MGAEGGEVGDGWRYTWRGFCCAETPSASVDKSRATRMMCDEKIVIVTIEARLSVLSGGFFNFLIVHHLIIMSETLGKVEYVIFDMDGLLSAWLLCMG